MGIRETLEKKKWLGVGIGVAMIALAGVAIAYQVSNFGPGAAGGNSYYTDDDGATFFADDSTKRRAPFDRNGKQAVKAHVFECGGKRVVGYMSRYTAEALGLFEEVKASKDSGKPPANVGKLASLGITGTELKKPGAANQWIKAGDSEAAGKLRVFRCPDGSTPPEVFP